MVSICCRADRDFFRQCVRVIRTQKADTIGWRGAPRLRFYTIGYWLYEAYPTAGSALILALFVESEQRQEVNTRYLILFKKSLGCWFVPEQ